MSCLIKLTFWVRITIWRVSNLFVGEGPGAAERRADGLAPLEGDGRDGPDAAQPGARSESGKELAP